MSSSDPKVVLLGIEGTYGVDVTPTPASDAILIAAEVRAPQLNMVYAERSNAKGGFGRTEKLIAGKTINVGFDFELAGAGVAGTAPKWSKALRTCAMAEKLLAAAVAGVATAGAAQTITLAAGASAVDNTYSKLRIRITSGTGSGQTRAIKSYNGTTKVATVMSPWATAPDATSNYSIDAQAAYYPVSQGLESGDIYFYYADALHKLLGARGDVSSLKWPNMQRPMASVDYQGIYGGIVDSASYPAAVLTGFQTPLAVNNQNTSLVSVHGYSAILYNLEFKLANKSGYRNLPGREDVFITDREPGGSIEFEKPTIATKDFPTLVLSGALDQVSLTHGTVAGNKVSVESGRTQLTNHRYGDQDGIVTNMFDLESNNSDVGDDDLILYAH